jgi:PAS domain S-box-containing protein
MPRKILYIEDSEEYAELAVKILRRADPDYRIRLTDGLAEIKKLLKTEPFDVILTDFNLKGFDAREVLRLGAELAPGVPVIVLTGVLSDETAVELLKAGASDYILKDRIARLPAAISAAIADHEKELDLNAAIRGLGESEARYRELFEASSDLIFLVSLDGEITAVNPAFQAATGFTIRKTPALTAMQLPAEEEKKAFARALAQAAAGREAAEMEFIFISAKGRQLTVQGSFHPKKQDGKVMYLQGIFRDITVHRSLEAQFRQAQKMEAVGRLAGGIAHDFNNMLCAIQGYATLSLKPLKDGDQMKTNLEEICKAVARAVALIKQLLVFSRKQPLQKLPCDLNALLTSIQPMMSRLIGENIKLKLDLDPELPHLLADASQLDQLLVNLVINARDAMPAGGEIAVRTRLAAVSPEDVRSPDPDQAGGKFILLSVKDSGLGMDKAVREHIFEPFFTTKERGKGTGLGLATVYGAVKQHNGWITVESEPGRGTEFSVYLPFKACGQPGADEALPRRRRGKRETAARILIIEDDPVLRGLSAKALTVHGHTARKAESIEEAMAILKECGEDFDIVFSDMVLGDGNIMTVAEELAKRSPKAGFIFTSGYLEEKDNWDYINRMGYKFIAKPFSVETLLRTIDETLIRQAENPA